MDNNRILELDDDKKYLIVEEIPFQNKQYFYLVNLEDETDYMFGEIINDEFIKTSDNTLIGNLLLQSVNNNNI